MFSRNQMTVAFGFAWCTMHFNSTTSFSRIFNREPDWTPSISIRVGGTEKIGKNKDYRTFKVNSEDSQNLSPGGNQQFNFGKIAPNIAQLLRPWRTPQMEYLNWILTHNIQLSPSSDRPFVSRWSNLTLIASIILQTRVWDLQIEDSAVVIS